MYQPAVRFPGLEVVLLAQPKLLQNELYLGQNICALIAFPEGVRNGTLPISGKVLLNDLQIVGVPMMVRHFSLHELDNQKRVSTTKHFPEPHVLTKLDANTQGLDFGMKNVGNSKTATEAKGERAIMVTGKAPKTRLTWVRHRATINIKDQNCRIRW